MNSVSVLFIIHNIHSVIYLLDLSCTMIPKLFIQMQIALFLKDRIKAPVIRAVYPFRGGKSAILLARTLNKGISPKVEYNVT